MRKFSAFFLCICALVLSACARGFSTNFEYFRLQAYRKTDEFTAYFFIIGVQEPISDNVLKIETDSNYSITYDGRTDSSENYEEKDRRKIGRAHV